MGCLPVATHARFIINGPLSHACGHPSLNRPPISACQLVPVAIHPPPLPVVTHHLPSAWQWSLITFQLLAHGYPSPMDARSLACILGSSIAACPWPLITTGPYAWSHPLLTGHLVVSTHHYWATCLSPPITNRPGHPS